MPRESNSSNEIPYLFSALGAMVATFWFPWIIAGAIVIALFTLLTIISWRKFSLLFDKNIERDLNSGNMFDFNFYPCAGDVLIIYSGEHTYAFKFKKWGKWKATTFGVNIPNTSNMRPFAKGRIDTTCDT